MAKYDRVQLLSILCYLGYLTIDSSLSRTDRLALKVPNLFMSKLFAQCVADLRLKKSQEFADYDLDISSLKEVKDDISPFAESCTEFPSRMCTNQVLSHMNEMSLNLALCIKLNTMRGVRAEMQKSLHIIGDGERFADLMITVNDGKSDECTYLIELKYLPKSKCTEERVQILADEASEQVLRYKSSPDFENRHVKAYAMVFVGPGCAYCSIQEK